MTIRRALLISILLLTLLSACGRKETDISPEIESDPPAQQQPEEPATQTVIEGEEVSEEQTVIKDTDGTPLVTVSITQPDVTDLVEGAAKKEIDAYYEELYRTEKKWWSGELVEFARENKKAAEDYGGEFYPFTVNETNEVMYDGEAFLSIKRDYEIYTGGAHGSNIIYCENFRKADGSLLQLTDVFRIEAYKPVVLNAIAASIEAEQAAGESVYYADWEALIDTCFDENAYYLGDEALTFIYQPYDVAPYSAGVRYFPVSYADISNELSESFLRSIYGGKK